MNLRKPSCCNQNFEGHTQIDIVNTHTLTHTHTHTQRQMCQLNEKNIKIYNMTSCKNVAVIEIIESKRMLYD
jgi:hypothetical protein